MAGLSTPRAPPYPASPSVEIEFLQGFREPSARPLVSMRASPNRRGPFEEIWSVPNPFLSDTKRETGKNDPAMPRGSLVSNRGQPMTSVHNP
jgi:hypothetical protein